MKTKKHNGSRGTVYEFKLRRPIRVNGMIIGLAKAELDHINYGLDGNKQLKKKKRFNFNLKDIETFLSYLNEEHIVADRYCGSVAFYHYVVSCSIKRYPTLYGKDFILFFSLDYQEMGTICTITLFPAK